jgi:hypothetical protein
MFVRYQPYKGAAGSFGGKNRRAIGDERTLRMPAPIRATSLPPFRVQASADRAISTDC